MVALGGSVGGRRLRVGVRERERGARMNAPPAFESFLLFEGEKK